MSKIVYQKSEGLTDAPLTYCPGCSHGIINKLVAESMVELGILQKTILISSVGCSVLTYHFFECDAVLAAHGRAPAVATGVKRMKPDKIVFTYQGDGDLASIGMAETIHAAHRGENITIIFVNNAIYGMTGGQMAPTSLIGQKTTTSPDGRAESAEGLPIKMCELLAQIPSAHYIERVSVHDVPHIRRAKKAIKQAFANQAEEKGFSIVEILAGCPVGLRCKPVESMQFVKERMLPYFSLGVFKGEQTL